MHNYYTRQHGGTLMGMIIGLLMGLAIALAVALAVTKTPMPFTNKLGKQDKATGANSGQLQDPNKPLYSNRAPAREAARPPDNTAVQAPPAKPAADVAAVVPAPTSIPAAPRTPDITADQPPAARAEDKWNYYLQAGAFRQQADAESIRARLALMGVEATISERQSDMGTLYRVRVGPFGQLEAMNRVRGKLTDNGVDVAVVRISK